MSDNQALIESNEALTAAIVALTAEVAAGNEGRAAVLAAAKGATEKPKTPTAAEKKAAADAAAKAAEAAEAAAAAEKKADDSDDVIGDLVVEYVSAAPANSEERTARKAKVKKLFGKVGAEKHTDIAAENIDAVAEALRTLIAKGNVIVEEAKPAASAANLLDDDE